MATVLTSTKGRVNFRNKVLVINTGMSVEVDDTFMKVYGKDVKAFMEAGLLSMRKGVAVIPQPVFAKTEKAKGLDDGKKLPGLKLKPSTTTKREKLKTI